MRITLLAALVVSILLTVSTTNGRAEQTGALTSDQIEAFQHIMDERGDQQALINAITNNDIKDLTLNREKLVEHDKLFSYKLESAGITNQRSSGRCWLFAGLNVLSPKVMARLNTGQFEFSQPYLAFWDKMEKANLFLEKMVELREVPDDNRTLELFLQSPFGDGGWWHYMTDLIDKYGLMPLSAMPETKPSSSTGQFNRLAVRMLRGYAADIRRWADEGVSEKEIRRRKGDMMADIYILLEYNYGRPPAEFEFRYESDDSIPVPPRKYTAKTFQKEMIGDELPDYVFLMDNPAKDYEQTYRMQDSRNMVESDDQVVLNLPIERLKYYAQKALLDSQAVWFACDVGKGAYSDSGLLQVDIYDYEGLYQLDFDLTKTERITYLDSYANHAMTLMGIDTTDDGDITKWLVENSWGTKRGDKGWWYMYDEWFDEYVYYVVVDRALLEDEERKLFEKEPIMLPVWYPLARALR